MRNRPPRSLPLEALLDERDHLSVQINLLEHDPGADAAKLRALRCELEEVERRIWSYQSRH